MLHIFYACPAAVCIAQAAATAVWHATQATPNKSLQDNLQDSPEASADVAKV